MDPSEDTYAYATVPYATDSELAAYADAPEVEIISNTEDCQALRKSSIGYASFVFYNAGACEDIEVSEPCIVNLYESNGILELSVCDPTMKLDSITVTVRRRLALKDSDLKVSVSEGENTVISVDSTRSVGRPYSARFEA